MDDQMVAPDAPALKRISFKEMESGFFRWMAGKIFFAGARGKVTYAFPVKKDGIICRKGSAGPFPGEKVDVINPDALGIREIVWEEPRKARPKSRRTSNTPQ